MLPYIHTLHTIHTTLDTTCTTKDLSREPYQLPSRRRSHLNREPMNFVREEPTYRRQQDSNPQPTINELLHQEEEELLCLCFDNNFGTSTIQDPDTILPWIP